MHRGVADHLGDYMKRWWLVGDEADKDRVRVRLHHILRSDAGRDLHDHPWWYVTIILRGGYWEITEKRETWRGRGVYFHTSRFRHRLDLEPGKTAWTLFITGPKTKEWGFYTDQGFVHWEEYTKDA